MCVLWITFLYSEYVLLSLVNDKVVWPIAGQDKVRRDNQIEDWDEEGQS